jgi:tetratricopeptide (TPR) repeat protein
MMFKRFTSAVAGATLAATLLGMPGPAVGQDTGSILAERAELDQAMRGDMPSRISALEKFIADHPSSALADQAREALVRTHATVGEQALKSGNPKAAAEAFTRALGAAPEKISDRLFLQVIWQMPVVMAASGYRFDGIQLMRSFEKRFESEPSRLVVIGNFFTSVESAPDAIRVLEKAAQVAPSDHRIYTALGTAYVISLRLDDAANAFAKAIELEPKEEFAYLGLANLRRATGNATEAIELYKKQLETKPDDAQSYGGLAIAYLMNDDEAAAGNALGRALALAPGDFRLYTQLGYFYASRGRIPKAREAIELSLRYEPRFSWTHITLGNVLLAEKRYKEAIEQLSQAQQYGDFPTLHYELGKAYLVSDQYDAAIEQFKAAFDLAEDGQFETSLGDVLKVKTSKLEMLLERERQAVLFLFEQPTTTTQYLLSESLTRINHALESVPDEQQPAVVTEPEPAPASDQPATSQEPPAAPEASAPPPTASVRATGNARDALVSTLIQTSLMGIAQVPAATRPRRTKTEERPPAEPPAEAAPAPTSREPESATTPSPSSDTPADQPAPAETQPAETSAQPTPDPTPTQPAETLPAATTSTSEPATEPVTEAVPESAPAARTETPEPAPSRPAAAVPTVGSSDEVISSDPGVTPGDAPLVFRPRKPKPAPAAVATEASTPVDVKPPDATGPSVSAATTPEATTGGPSQAIGKSDGRAIEPAVREALTNAIDAFLSVDDGREPFRKIWVARRLAEKGILLDRAEKLAAEALEGASSATEPERSVRDMPDLDRAARLAVITARAEDTLGWVLLKRGAVAEALDHLAKGSGEGLKDSDYTQRVWHYAIAKQESGDERAALDLYIRGFDPASPSAPLRRRQIEQLYKKLNNGTLDGLDQRLAQP